MFTIRAYCMGMMMEWENLDLHEARELFEAEQGNADTDKVEWLGEYGNVIQVWESPEYEGE